MGLDGKVALVTGAARGIGAGIAARFMAAGAAVVLFDSNGPAVRDTAERLCRSGRLFAIEGDVSREQDVKSGIGRTIEEYGRLDVLVNNAGIELAGQVPEMSAADWDRQLGVNLKGVFLCCKYAIPHMRERGGAIVNIASVHALVSYPESAAYDASKAGLIGLTRALALDHGRDGIRVNAICPGYIDTPMMHEALAKLPNPEEAARQVLAFHPLGRIGTPRDIADAALFLASGAASFITGTYLVVDGGMTVSGR